LCKLTCLENLPFKPMPHQISTATQVIEDMQGRAILADEVGLGKTIEAGLIIKEMLEQGKIKRVLILTPSSLAPQWCMEMKEKFGLYFYHNRKDHNWTYFDFIVASIDRAKRKEQLDAICEAKFDLLVVDEAHRLKNSATANFQAVKKIDSDFLLLLTATPMQNNLKELYNLIELVDFRVFGSFTNFKEQFVEEDDSSKNMDQLQRVLARVMIRNKKSQIEATLPERIVELIPVKLSPSENDLYEGVNEYIKGEYNRRRLNKVSILSLITLQREICSSSFAARGTLEHMGLLDLAELAAQISQNEKASAVEKILAAGEGKAIIFTEFKATQAYLLSFLEQHGVPALCYNGDMRPWDRVYTRHLFQEQYPVLISTEAGGEGVNLQKANVVINYDLPWNPMRVEQRIGRVHRLGQEKTVKIYNLFAKNTVEEFILALLRKKISLFEEAIGQLEQIVEGYGTDEAGIMDYLHGQKIG
jgi:SNF2 family DNA or RNA helicase